jgi:hypothetical protein
MRRVLRLFTKDWVPPLCERLHTLLSAWDFMSRLRLNIYNISIIEITGSNRLAIYHVAEDVRSWVDVRIDWSTIG